MAKPRPYLIPNVQGLIIDGERVAVLSVRTDAAKERVARIASFLEESGGEVPLEHRWQLSATDGRSMLLDVWWGDKAADYSLALAFDPNLNGVTMVLDLIRSTGAAILATQPVHTTEDLAEATGLVLTGLDDGLPHRP